MIQQEISATMKLRSLLVMFLMSLVFISCEDVIQMDLEGVEPRIVIDAVVTDRQFKIKVIISKTGDYADPSVFPRVSGAIVEISDDNGWSEVMHEVVPGTYENNTRGSAWYVTYTLKVDVEGTRYTASSFMPRPSNRLSVSYKYNDADSYDLEEGYYIHTEFLDREGVDDYYRIVVRRNGEMLDKYLLYDCAFIDGRNFDDNWGGFQLADTLLIQFQSLNEHTHDYFRTLSGVIAGEEVTEPNWSPANPVTNWDNGALGYFSAMSVYIRRVIIEQ